MLPGVRRDVTCSTIIALGVAFLTTMPLAAGKVAIRVADASENHRCSSSGNVVASKSPAQSDVVAVRKLLNGVPLDELSIEGEGIWHVSLDAPGCWSATETISERTVAVDLQVFSAGDVEGSLALDHSNRIANINAMVFPVGQKTAYETKCSITGSRWHCNVPAVVSFDLRLTAEGFAPLMYWNTTVPPGMCLELDKRVLERGASISGWVADPENRPLLDARAAISPLQMDDRAGRAAQNSMFVSTNKKGFFQFSGVPAGEYRLSITSSGLSTMVVPAITVRDGEATTWPRTLRLAPLATLEITLTPPLAPDGMPWRVEITERIAVAPGQRPMSLVHAADRNGNWSAHRLRAETYRVTVHDTTDAIFEEINVDLSNGSAMALPLTVNRLQIHGRLRVGGEPIIADLQFVNQAGKMIRTSSAADGKFAAVFPAEGEYATMLIYPRESGARISGPRITVDPKNPSIEIDIPGGRLRGVVTSAGTPARAAVHVKRDGRYLAQQIVGDDGSFDVIGISDGQVMVSAEGERGSTRAPVTASVRDGDTTDIDLVLEPYHVVRGMIQTPLGSPASGALIRVSFDRVSWEDLYASISGEFELPIPAESAHLDLLVLTHTFPVATVTITAEKPGRIVIQLQPTGGRLLVPDSRTFVIRRGVPIPYYLLVLPADFGGDGTAYLEAGDYAVCGEPRLTNGCKTATVASGTRTVVAFRGKERTP